jgi:hypothetical protein
VWLGDGSAWDLGAGGAVGFDEAPVQASHAAVAIAINP